MSTVRTALLCLAFAGLTACSAPPPQADKDIHLRVLTTHDFHGALSSREFPWSQSRQVGGAATLKAYLDRARAACDCTTVYLDGGDIMQGTLASNLNYGESSVATFGELGVDAAAIGNHELDWGVDTLETRIAEADFPWLAANVYRKDTGERAEWARPWAMIERDGLQIGVVGYLTSETGSIVRRETVEPFDFRRGYAPIEDAILEAEAAGADVIVISAHADGECVDGVCTGEMVEVANDVPDGLVDLILTGHNHDPAQGVVNGIPMIRAGGNGRAIGIVDFYRDADGDESFNMTTEWLYVDELTPDAGIAELIAPWLDEAEAFITRPVTTLGEDLSDDHRGDRRLGNLVADAVREAAGSDVAIHNSGGVRAPLLTGPVTYGDIFEVQPFDNEVVRLRLTGAELRDLLSIAGPSFYVSNMRVTFGDGLRVTQLTLGDGTVVEDDTIYTLGINDFLAGGGDDLNTLPAKTAELMGTNVREAMVSHFQKLRAPVVLEQDQRVWLKVPY